MTPLRTLSVGSVGEKWFDLQNKHHIVIVSKKQKKTKKQKNKNKKKKKTFHTNIQIFFFSQNYV